MTKQSLANSICHVGCAEVCWADSALAKVTGQCSTNANLTTLGQSDDSLCMLWRSSGYGISKSFVPTPGWMEALELIFTVQTEDDVAVA